MNQPNHGSDSTTTRVLGIKVFRSIHNFHLLGFLFVVAAQSPKLVDVACQTSAAESLPPWEWDLKPKGASSPKRNRAAMESMTRMRTGRVEGGRVRRTSTVMRRKRRSSREWTRQMKIWLRGVGMMEEGAKGVRRRRRRR